MTGANAYVGWWETYWVLVGTVFPESTERTSFLRQGSESFDLSDSELQVLATFSGPQTLSSASQVLGIGLDDTEQIVQRLESNGILLRIDPWDHEHDPDFAKFRLVARTTQVAYTRESPDFSVGLVNYDGEVVAVTPWTASVMFSVADHEPIDVCIRRCAELDGEVSVSGVWEVVVKEMPHVLRSGVAFLDVAESAPELM